MEINTNSQISNQVRGLESPPKTNEVRQEKDATNSQLTQQTKEKAGDQVNISDMAKEALAEKTNPLANQVAAENEINEQEARRLSEQTGAQLSQTNTPIANQAMQKAVDLFT